MLIWLSVLLLLVLFMLIQEAGLNKKHYRHCPHCKVAYYLVLRVLGFAEWSPQYSLSFCGISTLVKSRSGDLHLHELCALLKILLELWLIAPPCIYSFRYILIERTFQCIKGHHMGVLHFLYTEIAIPLAYKFTECHFLLPWFIQANSRWCYSRWA